MPTPPTLPAGPQGVLGDVTSVTLGPDGTLWVLHRGGATWGADTFDVATNKLKNPALIGVDVVLQMDPDTGARWPGQKGMRLSAFCLVVGFLCVLARSRITFWCHVCMSSPETAPLQSPTPAPANALL